MSNSTTHLDLVSSSQAAKEVTVNAALDAASPAMLYGRRASTSAALTWGYYGGVVSIDGAPTQIPNGTVQLAASTANYVEANPVDGSVSANALGFTAGRLALYQVVTGASTVSSYTDLRVLGGSASAPVSSVNALTGDVVLDAGDVGADTAGTAAAAVAAHAAASNPHPDYLTQVEGDARYLQSVGAQPFDVHAFYPGVPSASAKVLRIPVARAVTFPDDFVGSFGKASVAAATSTAFDVQKNGASVGTITFAGGASSATFVTSGATVVLAAGDILSIIAPASPDATLADAGFVLAGTR